MSDYDNVRAVNHRKEKDGAVTVWEVTDFEEFMADEDNRELAHEWFLQEANGRQGTVIAMEESTLIGSEEQEMINQLWSELAQTVDLDRIAYVAEGVAAMAVKQKVEAPNTEIDSFEDLEEAVEWASES